MKDLNWYVYKELEMNGVPDKRFAGEILKDLKSGIAKPSSCNEPGYVTRLEMIASGKQVDQKYFGVVRKV